MVLAVQQPRRGELARALGYWAARYREGQPTSPLPPAGDLRMALVQAAADGARRYLARPDIVHLHGVTGAMAVEILAAHIPATDGAAALAHVHAEHAALYAATEPVTQPHPASPGGSELAVAAVRSLDPHQVKLVEACQRGHAEPAIPPSPPPRTRSPACTSVPMGASRSPGTSLPTVTVRQSSRHAASALPASDGDRKRVTLLAGSPNSATAMGVAGI